MIKFAVFNSNGILAYFKTSFNGSPFLDVAHDLAPPALFDSVEEARFALSQPHIQHIEQVKIDGKGKFTRISPVIL